MCVLNLTDEECAGAERNRGGSGREEKKEKGSDRERERE